VTPENKFRERRSAHREEDAPADESPVGVPAAEDSAGEAPAGPIGEAPAEAPDMDRLAEADLPDPTFIEIVQSLVEQALLFLGEIPLTREGERRVVPNYAKHFIDLLALLEEKTRGNRTPEETQAIERSLAELRTLYLRVA